MKKLTRLILALTLFLAMVMPAALAAEKPAPAGQAPVISVQLDGKPLTFLDAVPQVKDQRTFLPFRAVLEAMGAEVGSEGNTITAARGDTTLTMRLGEVEATVTKNGSETSLTMDVAPYVDPETWRTYIPVRFAAQAFGCIVDWDQESSTVLIVDVEKLLAEAMEGKKFTYLEKLAAYKSTYNDGVWSMTVEEGYIGLAEILLIPFSASGGNTVKGGDQAELNGKVKLDMGNLISLRAQYSAPEDQFSPEEIAVLESFLTEGYDLSIRTDRAANKCYINIDGPMLDRIGIRGDTWYYLDIDKLYHDLFAIDTEWQAMLESLWAMDLDPAVLTDTMLTEVTSEYAIDYGDHISYDAVKESIEALVFSLSDEGFHVEGDTCTARIDGGVYQLELTLTMEGDAVTAYSADISTDTKLSAETALHTIITTAMGQNGPRKTDVNIMFTLDYDTLLFLGIKGELTSTYTPGDTAPQTEPPAGARVLNLLEMNMADFQSDTTAPF